MTPELRRHAWLLAGALALGAVANMLVGPSPGKVKPVVTADLPWQPVDMRVPELALLDPTWEARAPWGAAPRPVEPPPAPPPPPQTPVGIVGAGSAKRAIFMIHGAGELRVGVGGALPDGGRVLEVSARNVVWTDGAGARQERHMFLSQVDLPASAGPALLQGPSSAPPGMSSSPGTGSAGPSRSRSQEAVPAGTVPAGTVRPGPRPQGRQQLSAGDAVR